MKIVNLNYIVNLYYYLMSMTDEEISNFYINNRNHREKLFRELKFEFEKYGLISQNNTLLALKYLIETNCYKNHWRYVIPHEVPLDNILDKKNYIISLFKNLIDSKFELNASFDEFVVVNSLLSGADLKK